MCKKHAEMGQVSGKWVGKFARPLRNLNQRVSRELKITF